MALGAAFFGESMFSRATDASKVALVHLVARLKMGGYCLLDTQFVTDHLQQFGAVEIPRGEYRLRLAEAIDRRAIFERGPDVPWDLALS
jgi:leucyl/phenylalanyl-tRNA--protein transferase